jgi:hypothetical protein
MGLTPEFAVFIVRRSLKKRYPRADRSADAANRADEGY